MRRILENPVLPGFYPDPSVTRVGDDFYLVTSSFEYFPGVPLFHSKNLRDWRQLGHVLTRPSQLPLTAAESSQGIFAPTIRAHGGRFFMITTNMSHGGTFIVWADAPEGPWSEPIFVADESWGMDPSLFFDDDGVVYYTRHGGKERGAIYQSRIDVMTGKLEQQPVEIWKGTGGIWPEAPHLYKVGDFYYLLIAEGGTSYGHAVTVARSKAPFGPFEPCPRNPILTHRDRAELPIQATGHADLVQAADGSWWMVLLGIRPWDGKNHHIGRETFLAAVSWDEDGWPVVNEGRPIEPRQEVTPPQGVAWDEPALRPVGNPFSSAHLPPEWVQLRNPTPENYSLGARPGWLRLSGSAATLRDSLSPTFVGIRQTSYRATVSTRLEFVPARPEQRAGLVLRMNEKNHCALLVVFSDAGPRVQLCECLAGVERALGEVPLPRDAVRLVVEAFPNRYEFAVAASSGTVPLGAVDTLPLSSERAGGFTGVVLGLYATGVGALADFTDFAVA